MSVSALGAALIFGTAPVAPLEPVSFLAASALSTTIPVDGGRPVRLAMLQSTTPPLPDVQAEAVLAKPVEPPQTQEAVLEPGDIVVTTRARNVPADPLQEFNFVAFKVTQAIDAAAVRPAALAYGRIVPEPIRMGVRNFLDHLTEPAVFVNYVLQHKIGKAVETFGRFVVNSTIGVLGIFDIAKRRPFKLPHRSNGFADTMGFYGIKTGAFLYLPIVGPTTVRDLIGLVLDRTVVPFAVGKPFNRPLYVIPASVFGQLDKRDQFEEKMEALRQDSSGFYTATREDYLKDRQARIDALHTKRPKKPKSAPPPAPK